MRKQGLAFGLMLAVCTGSALAADNMKLNVKPGLWETTMKMDMSGMPPMPAIPPERLAQMPPEQRARLEAMMKGGDLPGKQHTSRSCVTADDLKNGPAFDKESGADCKRTIVNNSASDWEMVQECTGASERRVDVKYHALDSENIQGRMEMSGNHAGHAVSGKGTMYSRWLGSNCGDVKPGDTAE
jgi:hypothetical protein